MTSSLLIRGRAVLPAALASGLALAVLATAAGRAPLAADMVLALVLGSLLAIAAYQRPPTAVLAGAAVVILVPVYYGRYLIGQVAITPATAVCLVLLPIAVARVGRLRVNALDVAVLVLVVVRLLSLVVNFSSGPGTLLTVVIGVALPYAVFRVLTVDLSVDALARLVVACASVLSLVAFAERSGLPNPFFTLLTPQYQADELALPAFRLGGVRAEASFGDPIAFGMFLGLALVLAACFALTASSRRGRVAAMGACGSILYGLTATQSRGAVLVGVVGCTVFLLASSRRLDVLRLGGLAVALTLFAVSTPVYSTLQTLAESSTGDTRESRSAEYRLQILDVVTDPASFSLLGQRTSDEGGLTESVSQRVGLKSVDSEFAGTYLLGGIVGLLVFTLVALLVVVAPARVALTPVERAWAVGVGASYLNLLTVALLTQEASLLWVWTALLGSIIQRRRDSLPATQQISRLAVPQ